MRQHAAMGTQLLLVAAIAATHAAVESSHRSSCVSGCTVDQLNERLILLSSQLDSTDVDEVRAVIKQGADPSHSGMYNYTALMWSIVRKKTDVLHLLLESGADTESINAWGRNALYIAAWERNEPAVEALIASGADVLASSNHDAWTALHKASEMGHPGITRRLLEAGADPQADSVNTECGAPSTPLEMASSEEVRELLRVAIAEAYEKRAETQADARRRRGPDIDRPMAHMDGDEPKQEL
eukprot:6197822-Pleurochrysis_carterae.AAC.1